jgi:hypothetical protein
MFMIRLISLLVIPWSLYSQQLKLPLRFEVNQGQLAPQVKFLSRGSGYTLALQANGAALSLHKQGAPRKLIQMRFSRVNYSGVYPGIDVTYYGNQRELEYDITVSPHADPACIRLQFEGASSIEIDDEDLVLDHQLRIRKPFVYQTRAIPAKFVITSAHEVGFALGDYDPTQPERPS